MAIALLLLLPVLYDLVRRPTFRRLAFRNISRRKGEAALVIVGAMLGTAIITASYVVGDTIEGSIRDGARTNLGPIDESVRLENPAQLSSVSALLADPPMEGVASTMPVISVGAVAATVGESRLAEPSAGLLELDLDEARAFGDDPAATGLADAGPPLDAGAALIGEPLANRLEIGAGDQLEVFTGGSSIVLTVRTVLPEVGFVGYLPSRPDFQDVSGASPIIVAPGTIEDLLGGDDAGTDAEASPGAAPAAASTASTPPTAEVLVANGGDVFASAASSDAVVAEIEQRLGDTAGVEVIALKQDLLDAAADQGESISQLYQGIGWFSVIAGILLLVNLFVMLAEERKVELGMLRAVGFKRNHIVRAFAIEGATYSVLAAALGAVLGIGVGFVIVQVAASIFSGSGSQQSFSLVVEPASLMLGAAIGLTISLATVWGTSLRISRLNIIQAIRDLSDAGVKRRHWWGAVAAVLGVLAGLALFASGYAREDPIGTLAGPAIALFCTIPLLRRVVPERVAVLVPASAALVWGLGVFSFAGDAMGRADIGVFVVQGIVLVASAVTVLGAADVLWNALPRVLSARGSGLPLRLGLAYPLSRRFRTSMLLGMFAIVVFTMTFMSVLSGIFTAQVPTFAAATAAGFDLYVDSNAANPIDPAALAERQGVAATAVLPSGYAQFAKKGTDEAQPWKLSGFDEDLLRSGGPELEQRDAVFADDAAAWRGVLEDPHRIIVSEFFLQGGAGPPSQTIEVGDVTTLVDPASGERTDLTIAGVLRQDVVFNGAFVSTQALQEAVGDRAAPSRVYLAVDGGVDAAALATELQGEFLVNGARARTFLERAESLFERQTSFFRLLQGYLALGLLIGIAGLGVVMVRAVRERRRQIGMLRAVGVSSKVVRRSFVVESGFVAGQGILIGMVLGAVTSYQLLVNSSAFGDQDLAFALPWAVLAVLLVVPLAAALASTAAPASQAAKIKPAVALRIE